MNQRDYVSLLEVRCKYYTDHDYVPSTGGSPIFIPANRSEEIFFKIVVPDYDVPQAQLTGSRIYIAKLWDDKSGTMINHSDTTGIGICRDSQTSSSVSEKVKACRNLTKPEDTGEGYLPDGQRNYIIGYPNPIIGVYVKFDSKKVHDQLKKFDIGEESRREPLHRLCIGKNETEYNGYIPVENILSYEVPRRFLEKRDGFTGKMLVDWPPSVEYAESITGTSINVD